MPIHSPLQTVTTISRFTESLPQDEFGFGVLTFVSLHGLDSVLVQRRTFRLHGQLEIMAMEISVSMKDDRPYDITDEESILDYAGKLSGKTLGEALGELHLDTRFDDDIIGDLHYKGYFGQILEEGYFLIENNNLPEPDFIDVGIELKSAPLKDVPGKGLVSKERMVLGIIDYNEVPCQGFAVFSKKNSRILIVFFEWVKNESIFEYRIRKVVDWTPTPKELRVIKEDWKTIEEFIMKGEAHLLSERHTMFLAACRKGAGGEDDLREQPFSSVKAKQRALSFKSSFVNSIYHTREDVNQRHISGQTLLGDGESVLSSWPEGVTFEDHVVGHFDKFKGMTCEEIEKSLGTELNDRSKSYYSTLSLRMLGVTGKKVVEFEQAGIKMKTVRLTIDGRPKESMSFPAFKYEEIAEQEWEDSDFYQQIDRRFLFVVFRFQTSRPGDEPRRSLVFDTAFFWSMPEEDLDVIRWVWMDTREKVLHEDFDHFIGSGSGRLVHVRPHAQNRDDTYPFNGKEYIKRGFWFNDSYVQRIISESRNG